jgi:peptide/nickel transport system ATP-binding protein
MLLEVQGLHTAFPTRAGLVRAVDGVSLRLDHGQTLGIVGESGSGKSALVRSVMGLLPRSALIGPDGRVLIDGVEPSRIGGRARRHLWGRTVAMVFQDPMTSLNPVRRIGIQITDPLRYHLGMSRGAAKRRAAELLDLVGVPDSGRRLRQYPHELSGGMRQRVLIAIALSCEPALLIADEPTTALDMTVQRNILNLLGQLQRSRGMAMILVSHDLAVVSGRTDYTLVMYAGRVVESGPTQTLFTAARHPYTAALLRATPNLSQPSHTLLEVIAGPAPNLVDPPPGCRFAPRCRQAQPRCLQQDPPALGGDHSYRCFYPVGTSEGTRALATNIAAGRTAAGLDLTAAAAVAGRSLDVVEG